MAGDLKRRTFIGLGLAAAGGTVIATRARVGEARWGAARGLVEARVALRAELPGVPDGEQAAVRLVVTTPRGRAELDVEPLEVRDGRAEGLVRLAYPFAERVVGEYLVHAELRCGRHCAATRTPVRYAVRRLVWFA
ncbi:MAG: hypothetical protein H6744_11455 [Deltaproteobacteria bacterium]|nr:hypothetical protein [Deltaproteobacteria bacterium]MCB9787292.1 hypothetical protein [Deltaproteobacteria bacterium]